MLGIKKTKKQKKEELPELPKIPLPQPTNQAVDTNTIEANIIPEDKSKLLEWVIAEYKQQYAGLFSEKDLEELDQDATSLTILFAIYGELRIIRQLKEKGLLAGLK